MKKNFWRLVTTILAVIALYIWHDTGQVGRYKHISMDVISGDFIHEWFDTKTGTYFLSSINEHKAKTVFSKLTKATMSEIPFADTTQTGE